MLCPKIQQMKPFNVTNMKIYDYAIKKFSEGIERDSFFARWKEYNLNEAPGSFFRNLTDNSDPIFISNGLLMLGELEICEAELEVEILDYCRQLLAGIDHFNRNTGIYDIFESILWAISEIGSVDSLRFLQDFANNNIEKLRKLGNFEHILSACQFSFFRINQRQMTNFFIKIRSVKELPLKIQSEINALRKINPKYAEFQQFLLDNYKKYEGGILN